MREPDEILLGFTRALRSAGLNVTHDRATSFLEAAALVGAGDARSTYRAGRATLCSGPDDLLRFGHVFEAWFGAREQLPRTVPRETPRQISAPLPLGDPGEAGGEVSPDVLQVGGERPRGAPAPRRRRAPSRREGAARRDDPRAAAPAAETSRAPAYAVAQG